MLFKICHHTRYDYSNPIRLNPQQLRFRPRENCIQQVIDYKIKITPQPLGMHDYLDLEGNWVCSSFELKWPLRILAGGRNVPAKVGMGSRP